MLSSELQQLMPIQLYGKADVLFGNMEDIQRFHSSVFLRDLEECSAAPEQIGECFVERVSRRTLQQGVRSARGAVGPGWRDESVL